MTKNFTVLGKTGLDPLAPEQETPATNTSETSPVRSGEYTELLRRLFHRPSTVAVTASGAGTVQDGVCEGIAAELAAVGKHVVVVPVDRLLLMNPVRVIDDISLLPGVSPNVWVWPSIAQHLEVFSPSSLPDGENWLDRLRRNFHTVLLDCPPLESMPGVAEVSALVDATILVVESGRTPRHQIRKDQLALQRHGANLAGCILICGR